MATKLLGVRCGLRSAVQLLWRVRPPTMLVTRAGHLIPSNQYDRPLSKRFKMNVLISNWELIPMFGVTALAMFFMVFAIMWSCKNKVDVMFSSHNPANSISRTMDLRSPTVHKMVLIKQRYEPWNEMQEVLDKMNKMAIRQSKSVNYCT